MEERRDQPSGGDFAEGEETLPREEHVGSFAEGEETLPEDDGMGTFADSEGRGRRLRYGRPRG